MSERTRPDAYVSPLQATIEIVREQMEHADNYVRLRGVTKVCIALPYLDTVLKAAARAEQAASVAKWQPIETAPKDGRWFLGWNEDCGCFVWRDGPGLVAGEDPAPTHWMPLPPAPGNGDS